MTTFLGRGSYPELRLPRDDRQRTPGPCFELDVYAFMTTNALVATVNHKRMPVLLTRPEEFDAWKRWPWHVSIRQSRCRSCRRDTKRRTSSYFPLPSTRKCRRT